MVVNGKWGQVGQGMANKKLSRQALSAPMHLPLPPKCNVCTPRPPPQALPATACPLQPAFPLPQPPLPACPHVGWIAGRLGHPSPRRSRTQIPAQKQGKGKAQKHANIKMSTHQSLTNLHPTKGKQGNKVGARKNNGKNKKGRGKGVRARGKGMGQGMSSGVRG